MHSLSPWFEWCGNLTSKRGGERADVMSHRVPSRQSSLRPERGPESLAIGLLGRKLWPVLGGKIINIYTSTLISRIATRWRVAKVGNYYRLGYIVKPPHIRGGVCHHRQVFAKLH